MINNVVNVSKSWDNSYYDYNYSATIFDLETNSFKSVNCESNQVVNASPGMLALFDNYVKYSQRRSKVLSAKYEWRLLKYAAKDAGITFKQAIALKRAIPKDRFGASIRLLATKKFRSQFRQSLANQIRQWLVGSNTYNTPLSQKQLNYL